ncbi:MULTISPECIES: X2-like carbohydrate binding domain-containing protein [Clostridium]|uniref:X2-like carbohydrate binding domain-containing protein n=1 Tax=Clostridium TaxID=1485 RepID=UPI000824A548|nr:MULTISPECIES: X2-like carbohydrate binding domain-containing protein [Clostridium]PJI07424.1 hypothetical protein CUB90_05915 [Clostridium sp. CT7]
MKKRNMAILGMFMMMASLGISKNHVFAATNVTSNTSGIEVQSFNTPTSTSTNSIKANIKVINNTGADVDLSTLKLRYYFTEEGTEAESFWCDYSGLMGGATGYHNVDTSKVSGNFVKLDAAQSTDKANQYVEISFGSGSGTLEKGAYLMVQMRFAKSDWTSYDQSNDYSFNPSATDYADANNVTGYVNGKQEWGQEPNPAPTISPESGTYKQADPSEVSTTMSLCGGKLNSITNGTTTLQEGADKDYTVADNKVTFTQKYLSSLPATDAAGTNYNITFNFTDAKGNNTAATFKLTVIPAPNPIVTPTEMNFSKDNPTDQTTAMTLNGGKFVDVKDSNGNILEQGKDYTLSDNNIVFSKDYLSTLKDGTYTFTIDFTKANGEAYSATVTIKVTSMQASVKVDNATEKAGDPVTVPVKVSTKTSIEGISAIINYDNTKFTLKDVKPGDLVKDPDVNFMWKDDNGVISITYYDDTMGTEQITTDGILAYLDFVIKQNAAAGKSPLTMDTVKSAVSDLDGNKINSAFVDGSITVIGVPYITPDTAVFYTNSGSQADVKTVATFAGNTLVDVKDKDGKALTLGTDYTVASDGTITISKNYLAALVKANPDAAKFAFTIDFSDGTACTFTVNIAQIVDMEVANVKGTTGDSVEVPVSIEGVKGNSIEGVSAYIKYDNTKFTLTGVKTGALVKDPDVNFMWKDDNGVIQITYYDDTMGTEQITADGILAYLEFAIKQDAAEGKYDLAFDPKGSAIGSLDGTNIDHVLSDGSITVQKVPVPVINPEEVDVQPASSTQGDVPVNMTLNGYTFKDIKDQDGNLLKAGTDYTLSADGTTATINKSYFAGLANGTYTFTFEFSGEKGVKTATLTVKVSRSVDMEVANVTGATGDSVEVPVSIESVKGNSIEGVSAYIKYDNTKFTLTGVKTGALVKDPDVNFMWKDNNGVVEITYYDDSMGTEQITTDGILAYLEFAIKQDTEEGKYALEFDPKGSTVGSLDGTAIDHVLTDGSITVKGVAPVKENSTLNETSGTFDNNAPKAVSVDITLNGNTLKDIKLGGAVVDPSNYTVSADGSEVTFSEAYLATLPAGTNVFTFDFSAGKSADYTLTVAAKDVPVVKDSTLKETSGTFDNNTPADVTVDMNLNGNTLKDIKLGGAVVDPSNYTVSADGTEVTFSKAYLATLPAGANVFTFDFSAGKSADYTLTVKPISSPVATKATVSAGTYTVKAGDTITIPLTIKVVEGKDIEGITACLDYDASKFDVASITPGELVTNPNTDFLVKNVNGEIQITFFDDSMGSRLINKDGVFANIKLTAKSDAAAGESKLTFNQKVSSVGDVDGESIDHEFDDGSVTIE